VAIVVYVDDLAIFSSDEQLLRDTKECLMNRFAMKDLGEISRYLGLEVERTETTFSYHVAPYIAELVAIYLPDIHPPVLSPSPKSTISCKVSLTTHWLVVYRTSRYS
jgi:hypothetical protein